MKQYNEFDIKPMDEKTFEGQKIQMFKLFGKQIIIHFFEITDSKVYTKGTALCLKIQITLEDRKHIIFTSAKALINDIRQIPEDGFPFITTIVTENDNYKFT